LLAEAGIRGFHVPGVQTCALPISQQRPVGEADHHDPRERKEQEEDDEGQGRGQEGKAHPARQKGNLVSPPRGSLPTPPKKAGRRRRPLPPPPAGSYVTARG